MPFPHHLVTLLLFLLFICFTSSYDSGGVLWFHFGSPVSGPFVRPSVGPTLMCLGVFGHDYEVILSFIPF